MKIAICGAGLVAVACLAGTALAAVPTKKNDSNKMICRTMEETGSRLAGKRVCLTREQWRQQSDMQRENLEKAQRIRVGQDIQ
jgi:hypothetical protein